MLVAAAVLPHPPLLIPELAAGASHEMDQVRSACFDALKQVMAADCDLVYLVGAGVERATFTAGTRGSTAGFGVTVAVALPGAPDAEVSGTDPGMPLSLTVGAWLMSQAGWRDVAATPVIGEVIPVDATASDAEELGRALAASADRVAMVVMGDGASTLSVKAPGYLVPGAREWQDEATRALGSADVAAVAALSADDAEQYGAAGRAAWQVLAGAVSGATSVGAVDAPWVADLLADEAPYGVAYVVASWVRPA